MAADDILLIACSVFRPELEALQASGRLRLPARFFDSELHMRPAELADTLQSAVTEAREQGHRCLLCYGDCDPDMHARCAQAGIVRPQAGNCVDLLVGKQRRREWIREGAFVFLPEWTRRWRELLLRLPGLDIEQTRDILREQHRSLIYVDTGVMPVPEQTLQDCSAHYGLPYRIEEVDISILAAQLEAALLELDRDG